MQYNYPRLKLDYDCLYRYDLIDNKVLRAHNSFYSSMLSQLESSKTGNIELLSTLTTKEWFHGQKSVVENYSLTSVHAEKSTEIKITVRKFGFWNFLDTCLNSIFTPKVGLRWQSSGNYSRKNAKYCLTSLLVVVSENFILPKIKEKLTLGDGTVVSINFYNFNDFLDIYFLRVKNRTT